MLFKTIVMLNTACIVLCYMHALYSFTFNISSVYSPFSDRETNYKDFPAINVANVKYELIH